MSLKGVWATNVEAANLQIINKWRAYKKEKPIGVVELRRDWRKSAYSPQPLVNDPRSSTVGDLRDWTKEDFVNTDRLLSGGTITSAMKNWLYNTVPPGMHGSDRPSPTKVTKLLS